MFLGQGHKAVLNSGGVEIVQKFITSCPADKKFDVILSSSINVFLKCASKRELPVSSNKGAITFTIPSDEDTTLFQIARGKSLICIFIQIKL